MDARSLALAALAGSVLVVGCGPAANSLTGPAATTPELSAVRGGVGSQYSAFATRKGGVGGQVSAF